MKKIIVIFLGIFIFGCATSNISKKSTGLESGKGLVIGSITRKPKTNAFLVRYRNLQTRESGYFKFGQGDVLIPYFPKGELDIKGMRGNLIAAQLAVGDYEVYSWGVESGVSYVAPEQEFSIKFHVTEGKATYLGNFNFERKGLQGPTIVGMAVDYQDQLKRDTDALNKNYPNLARVPIESAIPKGAIYSNIGNGYSTHITLIIPVYAP